jgi:hypothetical protein
MGPAVVKMRARPSRVCQRPRAVIGCRHAQGTVSLRAVNPAPPMTSFSPAQFGAALDGLSNDRPALQHAIDAAHRAGGGTVIVPAGRTLLSGTLTLRSHVALHLEPGSRLVAAVDPYEFPHGVLLQAAHAEEISISGSGTIDGRGAAFIAVDGAHQHTPAAWRPRLLLFEQCRSVRLRDFTIHDSAERTVHLAGCDDVVVQGLTIRNNLKLPGTDGIVCDHARNVRISDCQIECGSDCIALKTTPRFADYGACENVVVRHCILSTSDAALKIGSETTADIRNVVFADCIVRRCHRGVGILLRDEGTVENVLVHDLVVFTQLLSPDWWGAGEVISVTARPRKEHGRLGLLRALRFSQIMARGEGGVFIEGGPGCLVEDLRLENIALEITKTSAWPARRDMRPPDEDGLEEAVTAGFHVRDARDVLLRECSVRWGPNCPACYGPAVRTERVDGLRLEHFSGHDAHFGERPAAMRY